MTNNYYSWGTLPCLVTLSDISSLPPLASVPLCYYLPNISIYLGIHLVSLLSLGISCWRSSFCCCIISKVRLLISNHRYWWPIVAWSTSIVASLIAICSLSWSYCFTSSLTWPYRLPTSRIVCSLPSPPSSVLGIFIVLYFGPSLLFSASSTPYTLA